MVSAIFWLLLMLAPDTGEFEVEAYLDRNEVPLGEAAILFVEARGDRAADSLVNLFPATDGLVVERAGQPSFARQRRDDGGDETILVRRWRFRLYPLGTGTFRIPALEVTALGDLVFLTEPLQLRVKEADDPRPPWKITITLDETRYFLHQPVSVAVALESAEKADAAGSVPRLWLPWLDGGRSLRPMSALMEGDGAEGCEVEIIGTSRREVFRIERSADGEGLVLTKRFQFLPFLCGEHDLDASFAAGPAAGADRKVSYHVASPPVFLVEPLPEEGRPASFTNGVGEFSVSFGTSASRVAPGDTFFLTLAVEGRGNLDILDLPDFPELESPFKVFSKRDGYSEGRKRRSFELAPRRSSRAGVPELRFSYFDPKRGRYETVSLDRAAIEIVRPPDGEQGEEMRSSAEREIGGIIEELPEGEGRGFPWMIVLLSGTALFAAAGLCRDQRRRWVAANAPALARRRALAAFEKRMKGSGDGTRPGAAETMDALTRYLEDRLAITREEAGTGDLREILIARGVRQGLAADLVRLVADLEEARFRGTAPDREIELAAAARAAALVESLEKEDSAT